MQLPLLQAHRGYWTQGHRENTIDSVLAAEREGYEMAEVDIHEAGCGTPIVFHDSNLLRIFRERVSLKEKSAEELYTQYRIPSLEQLLQNTKIQLNLEIKTNSWKRGRFELKIVECLIRNSSLSRVMISSFNPASLNFVRLYIPEIPVGWLISADQPFWVKSLWLKSVISFDYLHLDHRLLNRRQMEEYRQMGLKIITWTVDDTDRSRKLLDWGVESVITNTVTPQNLLSTAM